MHFGSESTVALHLLQTAQPVHHKHVNLKIINTCTSVYFIYCIILFHCSSCVQIELNAFKIICSLKEVHICPAFDTCLNGILLNDSIL